MSLSGRIVRKLPKWVRVSPLDVMFVFLGLPSSLAAVVGVAQSNALDVLPWWGPKLWAVALFIGCLAWLVGLTSVRETNGILILTRMPILLLGLHLVSITCLTYAAVLILFSGWTGVLAATAYLVISFGTWLRRVDYMARHRGDSL
jgi:hypothetical protein